MFSPVGFSLSVNLNYFYISVNILQNIFNKTVEYAPFEWYT